MAGKPITNSSLYLGAGAAVTRLSQEVKLTSSGYLGFDVSDNAATIFLPLVSFALAYQSVIIHVNRIFSIGNDTTSEGAMTSVTISYMPE